MARLSDSDVGVREWTGGQDRASIPLMMLIHVPAVRSRHWEVS